MTKVVISWAGGNGKKLGNRFYQTLKSTTRDLNVAVEATYSPMNMPIGEQWRSTLRDILHDADFGVILLEPGALTSLWLAYEAGFLDGGSDQSPADPVSHPFVFAADMDVIANTPFDSLQCIPTTREHIKEFCRIILSHAADGAARQEHVETLTDALHSQLADTWAAIREDEGPTREQLQQSLLRVVNWYADFGLVDRRTAADVENLLAVLRQDLPQSSTGTTVARELAEIAKFFTTFADAVRSSGPADVEFSTLATDWALNHLVVYAHEQLANIAQGRLPVKNRAPVRQFWQRNVFGRARDEIWTTNIGKPGDTMGNNAGDNLLASQKEAIERNVRITRVFVYNPEMAESEAHERRRVMRQQLDAGIAVRAISQTNFKARADSENAENNIGSTDFMVIDGTHVYLTYPADNDEISAEYVNGARHSTVLTAALAFRHVIDDWSFAITKQNLDEFPRRQAERIPDAESLIADGDER